MFSNILLFSVKICWLQREMGTFYSLNVFVLDLELPFLVVTITNLVFRVFTASLIGVYTFVELFLSFLVTYGVLKVTEKCEESANKRPEDQERIPEKTNTSLTIENEKKQPSEDAEAIQLERCESSKDGVNGASQPTANRDVESQKGLQVAEDPERGSEKKGSSEETKQSEVQPLSETISGLVPGRVLPPHRNEQQCHLLRLRPKQQMARLQTRRIQLHTYH